MRLVRQVLRCALFALLHLSAGAQNLVPDPTFTFGASSWTVTPPGTFQLDTSRSRHVGSGSARFSVSELCGDTRASICLPAMAGAAYDWGASVYFPHRPGGSGIYFFLSFYGGAGCTGPVTGGVLPPGLVVYEGSQERWLDPKQSPVVAPPGTSSMRYSFIYVLCESPPVTTFVDDVFFGPAGTIPPFHDADSALVPSLSSHGLAVLALALAVAGLRAIRGS